MFKLTAIARIFLGSFLVLLLNSNGVTVAFVTNSNPVAKPSTTGLSSLSELGGNSMVSFSQVLLPTYLGAAFAALSYKIDQDPQFMVEWVKEARQNPKTAVEQITMVASFGLVTIPPFAALHTMATAGKVATTTAAGTAAAGTAALAKTTTATKAVTTAKVAAATKTTAVAAAAATGGATIAIPTIAVPISFALATAYVSYEMDKDPDFAVKKLEAFVDLWHTKVVQREVSATSTTRSSTSTSTSITPSNPVATSGTLAVGSTPVVATSGTLAVGSTASAAVMGEDKVAITTAAAATVNKAEPVIVAVPTTTIAATPVDEEPTKVQKALRVLQSLYFPWLPMFVPPAGSRRHKAVKFAQALYFPWLPMFMPPKKQGAQQQQQKA